MSALADPVLSPHVCRMIFRQRLKRRLRRVTRSCTYCRRPLPTRGTTLDHIRPRSRGGRTTVRNVVLCCGECNSRKGNLTPLQLVRWSLRVLFVAIVRNLKGGPLS